MQHNRKITIATGASRKTLFWNNSDLLWSEFIERLKIPQRSAETLTEYLRYPKDKQDQMKDVGGYVGGYLINGRRKTQTVSYRSIITLDLDSIPPNGTQNIIEKIEALQCGYAIYSTRKHEPLRPRLRVIFPLAEDVSQEEYEPIARKIAELIGIEYADPTTFEPARLMYFPSICSDSEYICKFRDAAFIDGKGILDLYENWKDITSWVRLQGTSEVTRHDITKQGDPEAKQGIIGAFCRTYDIFRAMDELIPERYEKVSENRYTFSGGSTTGGAVIYENGNFIYSHHATDPASGKLCNSFDLVRLHLFGEKDTEAKPDTPSNKLPSFKLMLEYAAQIPEVTNLLKSESIEKVINAFQINTAEESPLEDEDSLKWVEGIQINGNGKPLKTGLNIMYLLENDPNLKGRMRINSFSDRLEGVAPLPWGKRKNEIGTFQWADEDDAGLRLYIEGILKFRGKEVISDALLNHVQKHSYNPVRALFEQLAWDGIERLDSMFIDFFGIKDNEYGKAIARKFLCGGVARVFNPGIKFDYMPVIYGAQGIGKSTFCRKLGMSWFTDSIKTFQDKSSMELVQGMLICEFAEMEAFSKADIRQIKNYLTQQEDRYRAPYAKHAKTHPRQHINIGTTNDHNYLTDPTGNRRFWAVDARETEIRKSVFSDLTEHYVQQLWAEAVWRWKQGEPLYLPDKLEKGAEEERAPHLEIDPLIGQIEAFLEAKVPLDWKDWDIERRRAFWRNRHTTTEELQARDRICATEIWYELMGGYGTPKKSVSIRINKVIDQIKGWERTPRDIYFGSFFGYQRGFRRQLTPPKNDL